MGAMPAPGQNGQALQQNPLNSNQNSIGNASSLMGDEFDIAKFNQA
jgi:hypothetical protein